LIARETIEEKMLLLHNKKLFLVTTLWGAVTYGAVSANLTEEDLQFLLE
jgi:SNF2 family DNA or RNA helicase